MAAPPAVEGVPHTYILLYYHYSSQPQDQPELVEWYTDLCTKQGLVGRVRVAGDGVNATLGGDKAALRAHSAAVAARFGEGIDFKLAESSGRKNDASAREAGFTSLRVVAVKEVVSLGADWGALGSAPEGGRHVDPAKFHSLLAEGGPETVVVDCRNLYETRIGHFDAGRGRLLDPLTRAFSDFPAWVDAHQGELAGRQILMYCTGGVRCERASSYLRSLGEGFQDVCQLHGGIQRYLEAYPDGGLFRGRNFVFDERGDVPPAGAPPAVPGAAGAAASSSSSGSGGPVGSCLACSARCDDYGPRCRCATCRMLVLVCSACAASGSREASQLSCELCQRRSAPAGAPTRPLRLLCLHGFRQTGRSFGGRLHALRKRLKGVAELVFVDGPHQLPAYMKPHPEQPAEPSQQQRDAEEEGRADAAAAGAGASPGSPAVTPPRLRQGQPRRAWMLIPEQYAALQQQLQQQEQDGVAASLKPGVAPAYVDDSQHRRQTEGWPESWAALDRALREQGPFDGVLGFSQGAAVAAVLCAEQAQRAQQGDALPDAPAPLRFAVICSGYVSASPEHEALLGQWRGAGGVPLPSLHIFGGGGGGGEGGGADRQVGPEESAALMACFDPRLRSLLRHGGGHIVPSTRAAVARMRDFLLQQCPAAAPEAQD